MRTDIGEELRRRRRERHWKQDDLSRATGIGRGDISRFENGHEMPNPRMLARLGLALGDVFELFDLTPYGRKRAVLELESIEAERAEKPRDVEQVIADALRDGGWHGDIAKGIRLILKATRPQSSESHLQRVAEQRAAYEC